MNNSDNVTIDKGNDGKYKCDQCDFTASHKSVIKRHKKSLHSASNQEIFVCDQCDYSSNYKHNITKHKSALHSAKKTVRALRKNPRTPSKTKFSIDSADSNLSTYSVRYSESINEEEEYFCDLCDTKFAMKENFWRHKQIKHEGTRYSCDQCDVQLTIKENLRRHKQRIHGTDLTY